jgi:hypothetical protein
VDRKDKPGGGVAQPEDLDVNMVGSELLFILTSTGDPLRGIGILTGLFSSADK